MQLIQISMLRLCVSRDDCLRANSFIAVTTVTCVNSLCYAAFTPAQQVARNKLRWCKRGISAFYSVLAVIFVRTRRFY